MSLRKRRWDDGPGTQELLSNPSRACARWVGVGWPRMRHCKKKLATRNCTNSSKQLSPHPEWYERGSGAAPCRKVKWRSCACGSPTLTVEPEAVHRLCLLPADCAHFENPTTSNNNMVQSTHMYGDELCSPQRIWPKWATEGCARLSKPQSNFFERLRYINKFVCVRVCLRDGQKIPVFVAKCRRISSMSTAR